MSTAKKYRICQAMFAFSFAAVVFSMLHMSPFAPAHHNIQWFIALSVSAAVGIGFGLGFYYYRTKRLEDTSYAVRTQALANAGQSIKKTSRSK